MASVERAVEAWEGALTDTSEVLEGMVAAVREAGDAALALQVSVSEAVAGKSHITHRLSGGLLVY